MKDPRQHCWRCWQQSPGACLAFGGLWLGHVIVPVSVSGTILVVSIWFTPDLSAASVVQLFAIASFYLLLPWMARKLTRWLWRQSQVMRARIHPRQQAGVRLGHKSCWPSVGPLGPAGGQPRANCCDLFVFF